MPSVFLSPHDRLRLMRLQGSAVARGRSAAARALLLLHAGFSPRKVRLRTALPSSVILTLARRVEREGIHFLEMNGGLGSEVGPPARPSEAEKMRQLQRLMPPAGVLAALALRPSTEGIDVESDPAELSRRRPDGLARTAP